MNNIMTPETRTIKLSQIVFDENVYPRKEHSDTLVQKYIDCLDQIEARGNYISIAADFSLLDGRHRHLAYLRSRNGNDPDISVFWYPVTEEKEKVSLATELNSEHGDQLSIEDKKMMVIRFYSKYGFTVEEAAKKVRVRKEKALEWTKAIREEEERRLNEKIFDMWLACKTEDEIAEASGLKQQTVNNRIEALLQNKFPGTKLVKLSNFELEISEKGEEIPDEAGWKRPLYNVWAFAKKSNSVNHHGNSEQRILENLLYLYTEPFDIVLDPFAGGGSTIDICKKRLRRYWISDRKPIEGREIRLLDITQELPPLHKRWSEVTLTYLDPPYWRQALNKYSKDDSDLANMPLDKFTESMASIIKEIAAKQSKGVIAMLMQPTQWSADNRQFTDHVFDIIKAVGNKRLVVENRVSCPYATEQYNAQQVEWAKANKKLLVISRELVIWRLL